MSPIGPRVPAVKAHLTVMPPDTEPDEEHKATEAFSESSGEHAHTHMKIKAGKHIYMHKSKWAYIQSVRPDHYTYEPTNRQINTKSRWMHSFTGTLKHTQTLAQNQKHSKPFDQHKHRPAGTPWHSNSQLTSNI